MARNMGDLILLDGVLRSDNTSSRGQGALPAPGVSCAANVDQDFSLEGVRIGLPLEYWETSAVGIDPAVGAHLWLLGEAVAETSEEYALWVQPTCTVATGTHGMTAFA